MHIFITNIVSSTCQGSSVDLKNTAVKNNRNFWARGKTGNLGEVIGKFGKIAYFAGKINTRKGQATKYWLHNIGKI